LENWKLEHFLKIKKNISKFIIQISFICNLVANSCSFKMKKMGHDKLSKKNPNLRQKKPNLRQKKPNLRQKNRSSKKNRILSTEIISSVKKGFFNKIKIKCFF